MIINDDDDDDDDNDDDDNDDDDDWQLVEHDMLAGGWLVCSVLATSRSGDVFDSSEEVEGGGGDGDGGEREEGGWR